MNYKHSFYVMCHYIHGQIEKILNFYVCKRYTPSKPKNNEELSFYS